MSAKVLTRRDVGQAANYYANAADDYYKKEGEACAWQGVGAALLGLSGEVDPIRFRQLLAGIVDVNQPNSRGSTRDDLKERIGIDLTFSAPKSVSIQALIGGDQRIIEAHDRAVTAAVEAAEARALARYSLDGVVQVENTANLIVAKFRHETSRERDPQLHTHAVVMNLTRRSDGKWRAIKNDEIVGAQKLFGAVYRAELAAQLLDMGFQLRHERDGAFELAHISPEQIHAFSKRAQQIEAKLFEMGVTRETATSVQKQLATMQTRVQKRDTSREEIAREWQTQARELGIDFGRRDWHGSAMKFERTIVPIETSAQRAVLYAIKHLTERSAIVNENALRDTAMAYGVGSVRMADITKELKRQSDAGYLIPEKPMLNGLGQLVERRFTTQGARELEKRILQIERDGRGKVAAIARCGQTWPLMESAKLNAGQRDAVTLALTTTNRIVGVQGDPGTGKSHMLRTMTHIAEDHGYQVLTIAPYGAQVKALRELGVASRTAQSFLVAKEKGINANTVLVVDEAAVVPTRVMEKILKLAEAAGTHVVLMGDIGQTKAIEAGRPFDQLQKAGMETAHMTEIQRQTDPELKRAVELAARAQTSDSLQHIADVREIADDTARRAAIVADYMALSPEEREKTLMVAGTNDARREINQGVRAALGLDNAGLVYQTLRRVDSTKAERRLSRNYQPGDVIQPEANYKSGLVHGSLYTVLDTGPGNRLTVAAEGAKPIVFSPAQVSKLSLYRPEYAELSIGDTVRITRNDAALDLANGDRFKVVGVGQHTIDLQAPNRLVTLPADGPLHIDYAYATTVHSAQGLTAERVLFEAQTHSRTTASDVYLVAISRARAEAKIYTNDRKALPEAIERENVKHAALDLKR